MVGRCLFISGRTRINISTRSKFCISLQSWSKLLNRVATLLLQSLNRPSPFDSIRGNTATNASWMSTMNVGFFLEMAINYGALIWTVTLRSIFETAPWPTIRRLKTIAIRKHAASRVKPSNQPVQSMIESILLSVYAS